MNTLYLFIAVATAGGFVLGVTLFPWAASPAGFGIPLMNTAFGRIFLTISQIIRGKGVLVKRSDNQYEIGTYDEEREVIVLDDGEMQGFDADNTRWRLFGKRPFAVTWQPGTDFHQRIQHDEPTDGGGLPINMGAAHRLLEGTNEDTAINRTKEHAQAAFGGHDTGLGQLTMAILVGVMVVLGSLTTWIMI